MDYKHLGDVPDFPESGQNRFLSEYPNTDLMSTRNQNGANATKAALLHAFNELVLSKGDREIRVADIIRLADVGRSTFYDHYSSVEAVHNEAIKAPFSILADATTGRNTDNTLLILLLSHFEENRERAIKSFLGTNFRDQAARILAELVEEKLTTQGHRLDDAKLHLVAWQIAESAMALIRVWITGEVDTDKTSLAETIVRTAGLLREGLLLKGP